MIRVQGIVIMILGARSWSCDIFLFLKGESDFFLNEICIGIIFLIHAWGDSQPYKKKIRIYLKNNPRPRRQSIEFPGKTVVTDHGLLVLAVPHLYIESFHRLDWVGFSVYSSRWRLWRGIPAYPKQEKLENHYFFSLSSIRCHCALPVHPTILSCLVIT